MLENRFLTKDNIFKRGRRNGDKLCQFCDKEESIQHLFFDCSVAKLVWNAMLCALNITSASDINHLLGSWLSNFDKHSKQLVMVGVAAVLWAIWKLRNKACFDKKIWPNDPIELIYLTCRFIENWAILQKSEARQRILMLGAKLARQVAGEVFSSRFGWRIRTRCLE